MKLRLAVLAGLALAAVPAFGDPPASASITVTGSVGNACHMGTPTSSTLSLGALAAQSDGTLAAISPAPSTTITGSWCNAGSTIGVLATPLIAQHFAGAPSAGFTKAVNYKAAASGWTATPATFTTTGDVSGGGNSTTPGTQTAGSPVAETVTVALSDFASPVSGYRLVADSNYSSTITITLTAGP
jgi:hypothetical protein